MMLKHFTIGQGYLYAALNRKQLQNVNKAMDTIIVFIPKIFLHRK